MLAIILLTISVKYYIFVVIFTTIIHLVFSKKIYFFNFFISLHKSNKDVKLNKFNKKPVYLWKPLFKKNSYFNYFTDNFTWKF